MTKRKRFLSALDMEQSDYIPFWPKLSDAYLYFNRKSLPSELKTMLDCHKYIGSEINHWADSILKEVNTHCKKEVYEDSRTQIIRFVTPCGEVKLENRFHEPSQAWHPVEHPIKCRDDLAVLKTYFKDTYFESDPSAMERERERKEEIGDLGILAREMDESPFMNFVEWLAGVAQAHYMLFDYEVDVLSLFKAAHEYTKRKLEATFPNSCCDLFYMVENTSTSLISPTQFMRYNIDHLHEYAALAKKYGKRLALHMCGLLKDLLPEINSIEAVANEAFTSPPVGNTRLIEGRLNMPERCILGGTNAVLWEASLEEIQAELKGDLDALPHHRGIIVTSGGVMPPSVPIDKIKTVCDWVHNYPAIF